MHPVEAAVPTARVVRVCAGGDKCRGKQRADAPLTVQLQPTNGVPIASIAWARADGVPHGGRVSAGGTQLTIPAAALPAGAPLTLVATLTGVPDSVNGAPVSRAAATVDINAAPFCAAVAPATCLVVQARRAAFPGAEFVASIGDVADNDDGAAGLTYEWGLIDPADPKVRVRGGGGGWCLLYAGLPAWHGGARALC